MIGSVELINNLYILNHPTIHCTHQNPHVSQVYDSSSSRNINSATTMSFDLWHYRLGHPSFNVSQTMSKYFPYISINKDLICDSCHLAKQCRLSFPNSVTKSQHAFELVHMDIWGPVNTISMDGNSYFLTIVDDFTRHTWIFLMKSKSETRLIILYKTLSLMFLLNFL